MTPTIGRIVHYKLTEDDALKTYKRREDARSKRVAMSEIRWGFQAHMGNPVDAGEIVPMIIVFVFDNPDAGVNGQVFLDGSDSLWVTSVKEGEGEGEWFWPPREE